VLLLVLPHYDEKGGAYFLARPVLVLIMISSPRLCILLTDIYSIVKQLCLIKFISLILLNRQKLSKKLPGLMPD